MAEDFVQLQHELENDVAQLHAVWNLYRQLFAVDDATIDLLNNVAPFCFRTIHDALIDEVILHIARLCDRPQICGKSTLVLKSLIDHLPPAQAGLSATLKTQLADIRAKSDKLIEHRHNRIAHTNLDFAMRRDALPGFSREMLKDALESIRAFMKTIHPEMHFEDVLVVGTGNDLLESLRNSKRLSDLRDKAWSGEITPEQVFDEVRRWSDQL